jgi:hypothetical protein
VKEILVDKALNLIISLSTIYLTKVKGYIRNLLISYIFHKVSSITETTSATEFPVKERTSCYSPRRIVRVELWKKELERLDP